MDLQVEERQKWNPLQSSSAIVILKIANSPGMDILRQYAGSIRLMDPRYLPHGEPEWTCRVWLKEVLKSLHNDRYITLDVDIG
ncbi:hypothetical protein PC116_g29073 [Phytophthora cactorum]|nr:hypothetical protein PC116_g29073 [Phytophthora cactorum]